MVSVNLRCRAASTGFNRERKDEPKIEEGRWGGSALLGLLCDKLGAKRVSAPQSTFLPGNLSETNFSSQVFG